MMIPGVKHFLIPDHDLMRGRCYYVLPRKLLDPAIVAMNSAYLDRDVIEFDLMVADGLGTKGTIVGFWNRQPIRHAYLQQRDPAANLPSDQKTINSLGWEGVTSQNLQLAYATGDRLMEPLFRCQQAYCGWLCCNPEFVEEERKLWRRLVPLLGQFGVPCLAAPLPSKRPISVADTTGRACRLYRVFAQFADRWRLEQLPGPGLPQPHGVDLAGLGIRSSPDHGKEAVLNLHLPRNVALLGAEELAESIEYAMARSSAPAHLRPWETIVAKSNIAKHVLPRWARIFMLQHYWRVLHERYAEACDRRAGQLKHVFAKFLNVGVDTVHVDLRIVRSCLGPAWFAPAPIR